MRYKNNNKNTHTQNSVHRPTSVPRFLPRCHVVVDLAMLLEQPRPAQAVVRVDLFLGDGERRRAVTLAKDHHERAVLLHAEKVLPLVKLLPVCIDAGAHGHGAVGNKVAPVKAALGGQAWGTLDSTDLRVVHMRHFSRCPSKSHRRQCEGRQWCGRKGWWGCGSSLSSGGAFWALGGVGGAVITAQSTHTNACQTHA